MRPRLIAGWLGGTVVTVAAVILTVALTSGASGPCALPPNWNHLGAVLLEGPIKWAYPSQHVDLTGSGPYALDFGPVPASLDWPATVHALSLETPPGWNVINARDRLGELHMVTIHGRRYLSAQYTVTPVDGGPASCSGFSVWIYH